VRLQKILPEYQGKVKLRDRAFPLEIYGSGPPNRKELELEMWLAALQEPEARFKPFKGSDWPSTTLPAFEAAWCAFQQDEEAGRKFDLLIRQSFFAEGRNIGQKDVMRDLAHEAGLDMDHFTHLFDSGEGRVAALAEGRLGKEKYNVHGTPTIMLADGTKLRHPIAYAQIKDEKIQAVGKLPCCGDDCYEATRSLFEQASMHKLAENTLKG
jgi:predicted DsbA family dithiol-disulfide isomerase